MGTHAAQQQGRFRIRAGSACVPSAPSGENAARTGQMSRREPPSVATVIETLMDTNAQTTAQGVQESFDHTWSAEIFDAGDSIGVVNGLSQLRDLLTDHAAGHPPVDVTLRVDGAPTPLDFVPEWGATGQPVRIRFEDGSALEIPSDEPATLDTGTALLEPITPREYASVETILDQLWKAIEAGQLDDHHLLQLQAIYEVLFADHRDTTVGETPRHRLIGTVRSLALMSNHEGIRAGLAWWKIAEICYGIDWHSIGRIFPGGPG